LKSAYESQSKEIEALRNALRVSDMQREADRRVYENRITEATKKGSKKGRRGFIAGIIIGFGLGAST